MELIQWLLIIISTYKWSKIIILVITFIMLFYVLRIVFKKIFQFESVIVDNHDYAKELSIKNSDIRVFVNEDNALDKEENSILNKIKLFLLKK